MADRVGRVLSRAAPLRRAALAVVGAALLAGCDGSAGSGQAAPPAASGSVAAGTGDDTSNSPTSAGPPIGVPTDACRLLDPADVARVVDAKQAQAKSSTQGPIRSCEYTISSTSGGTASLFLDLSDQRPAQLYDVATTGVPVTTISVGALKASFDPTSAKVYVLTVNAFFSLQLPTSLDTLASTDQLRSAAEELASAIAARLR
jgi:hypothetical protein